MVVVRAFKIKMLKRGLAIKSTTLKYVIYANVMLPLLLVCIKPTNIPLTAVSTSTFVNFSDMYEIEILFLTINQTISEEI